MLAEGKTNPNIAEHLDMTLDGAKWHVSQVLWKLGFTSREEAAAFRRWQLARRNRVWPRPRFRDPRWTVAGVFLVLGLVAFALTRWDGPGSVAPDGDVPKLVEVAPFGESVSRLSVIEIVFAEPPASGDPAELVTIEPAVDGVFSWTDGRTLVFQPASPGLVQGQQYRVSVKTKGGTLEEATVTQTFVTAGLITVDSVTPEDGEVDVPAETEFLVQFSASVGPPPVIGEQRDEPVVIIFDPPLAGNGEWLDSTLYRFTPREIAPNTTYTASIPAELKFALDGELAEDFSWTFTTYGPEIESIFPTFNLRYANPRQRVTVRFNQPMDRASVEAGFVMRQSVGGSRDVEGTFVWSEDDSVVTFTPSEDLKLLSSYQVDISRGLVPVTGEAKSKRPRTVVFTTIGVAKVAATRPYAGAEDAGLSEVEIRFANPMDIDSVDGLISVSGFGPKDIRMNWSAEDKTVRIELDLEASTEYTVTIAEGGLNVAGLPLAPFEYSFTTGEPPPSVAE
jgi:alpha-2-macroglobulin